MSKAEDIDNEDEWEEIDPQEVELILSILDGLMDNIRTDTLVAHLQEAYEQIEALADWDEEDQAEAA